MQVGTRPLRDGMTFTLTTRQMGSLTGKASSSGLFPSRPQWVFCIGRGGSGTIVCGGGGGRDAGGAVWTLLLLLRHVAHLGVFGRGGRRRAIVELWRHIILAGRRATLNSSSSSSHRGARSAPLGRAGRVMGNQCARSPRCLRPVPATFPRSMSNDGSSSCLGQALTAAQCDEGSGAVVSTSF